MRKKGWKILVMISIVLWSSSPVFAQGLSGWFDINHNTLRDYEDGNKVSESETFNRNLYLNLQRPITRMLSYQIYLRSNFSDRDLTDISGDTTTSYRSSVEPSAELLFSSPLYGMNIGYRRQEQWDTAQLDNDGRETTEFSYARFNLTPEMFPSLHFDFDEQRKYDHLDDMQVDSTDTTYSVSSSYYLPSQDVRAHYTVNYAHIINKTPLGMVSKSVGDNFNGDYAIGYSGKYGEQKGDYRINYQGNYSRNKTTRFVDQPGAILIERIPFGGLYDQGAAPPNDDVDVLSTRSTLVDNDVNISAGIPLSNVGSDEYQNMGIQVSSQRSVDRLFIYVNSNISTDAVLGDVSNWRALRSDSNSDPWADIPLISVTISVVDITADIYRYEIEFLSPQNASYFKVINLQTSGVANVFVTEIEAFGTDDVDDDEVLDVTSFFTQRWDISTTMKLSGNVDLNLYYSIDRSDENPSSLLDSIGGILENIFTDSTADADGNFRSDVRRNYSATATWYAHTLLTNAFRVLRSESFDNREITDTISNTYDLSFQSVPLPTLDATLHLIRSDSFRFNQKDSTNHSLLLSVGSKLYRDVNMTTDAGYTESESFTNDTTSSSPYINGSLDAVLTRRMSVNLDYGFSWTTTDGSSSRSKDGSVIMTYRPGKFFNISGTLAGSDSNGDVTTAEGILIDWLPLRAVRLNMNYYHRDAEPGPVTTDSLSGYAIWYITRFADVRFAYAYTRKKEAIMTEQYNVNTQLNCRF